METGNTRQEGPKTVTIPAESYKSCSGCVFYEFRMVRSGLDPLYSHSCMHKEARIGGVMRGNLSDDHTPDWCPIEVAKAIATTRRSGRTTRLIDAAVQEFFEKGYVLLSDHEKVPTAHRNLLDRFMTRMLQEHGIRPQVNKSRDGLAHIIAADAARMEMARHKYAHAPERTSKPQF